MTTFLEEVAAKSTWCMLPLELGCINDGNEGTIASKGVAIWRFKIRETKTWKGPPNFNAIKDGKGEITSVTTKKEYATFDSVGNRSRPKHECEDFHKPPPS